MGGWQKQWDTILDILFPATNLFWFSFIMAKNKMGPQHKFVKIVGGLVMIDCAASIILNILIIISTNPVPPYFEEDKEVLNWMPNVFHGISNVSFNCAMYIMAHQYNKIANEVPQVLKK